MTTRSKAVSALLSCGLTPPDEILHAVRAEGEAAVPSLIALLEEHTRSPGRQREEYAAKHAADLLGEQKATAAIAPMIALLSATTWESEAHEAVCAALTEIGEEALEPLLAAYARTKDRRLRDTFASVLSGIGVEDERIFAILERDFDLHPALGAVNLSSYGDPRGLPILERAIERYDLNDELMDGTYALEELVESYEDLADTLPAPLQARVDALRLEWEAREAARRAAHTPVTVVKVGRNDPCPCGSGKKSKKCCDGKPAA